MKSDIIEPEEGEAETDQSARLSKNPDGRSGVQLIWPHCQARNCREPVMRAFKYCCQEHAPYGSHFWKGTEPKVRTTSKSFYQQAQIASPYVKLADPIKMPHRSKEFLKNRGCLLCHKRVRTHRVGTTPRNGERRREGLIHTSCVKRAQKKGLLDGGT